MRFRLVSLTVLLLAACTSTGAATPEATLQVFTIARTPALEPLTVALLACGDTLPETRLRIVESPVHATADPDIDLFLRLGEADAPSVFAAAIAWERIVVVVNPANPIETLTSAQAAALFAGQVVDWGELGGAGEMHPWVAMDGEDWRAAFGSVDLVSPNAQLAPDPAAMLEAVAGDELAIGYLPRAWATDAVKVLDLGVFLPVLALANGEPQGASRAMLACLQGEVGQAALGNNYTPWGGN